MHPRFHTPSVAIVVQAVLAIILLLLGGSFRQFFSLAIFSEWLFYMIAGSTVFVFRQARPRPSGPTGSGDILWFRRCLWLAAAVLLYYTFTDNLRNSRWVCLVILAGIPVFYGFARRRVVPSAEATCKLCPG